MSEKNIQNACFLALGSRPDVLIFRQQSGVFRAMDSDRIIKVGVPGMSDALAVVSVEITPDMVGKTVAVAAFPEFKTSRGRQADAQHNFQNAVRARGAVYRLIRSVDDIQSMVDDIKSGQWK